MVGAKKPKKYENEESWRQLLLPEFCAMCLTHLYWLYDICKQ